MDLGRRLQLNDSGYLHILTDAVVVGDIELSSLHSTSQCCRCNFIDQLFLDSRSCEVYEQLSGTKVSASDRPWTVGKSEELANNEGGELLRSAGRGAFSNFKVSAFGRPSGLGGIRAGFSSGRLGNEGGRCEGGEIDTLQ